MEVLNQLNFFFSKFDTNNSSISNHYFYLKKWQILFIQNQISWTRKSGPLSTLNNSDSRYAFFISCSLLITIILIAY